MGELQLLPPPTPAIAAPKRQGAYHGRNTNYRPEFCDNIIAWMEERCRVRHYTGIASVVTESLTDPDRPGSVLPGSSGKMKTEARQFVKDIPQISDWCWETGKFNIVTAQNWTKQYPDFGLAYARARSLQEGFIRSCMADGTLSSATGAFFLKNLCGKGSAGGTPLVDGAGGWSDKVEISASVATEEPVSLGDCSPHQLELIEACAKACAAAGIRLQIIGIEQR